MYVNNALIDKTEQRETPEILTVVTQGSRIWEGRGILENRHMKATMGEKVFIIQCFIHLF